MDKIKENTCLRYSVLLVSIEKYLEVFIWIVNKIVLTDCK